MLDVTIFYPLSLVRDGLENPQTLLKNSWDEKIRGFGCVRHPSATAVKLVQVQISSHEGRHPDAHRAMGTIAVNIASRTMSSFHYARAHLIQRYATLLVRKNAVSLKFRFDF